MFKRWLSRERVGHVLILKSVIPLYSGFPAIANKTLAVVVGNARGKGHLKDLLVRIKKEGSYGCCETYYDKNKVLTQKDIPIVVTKSFKTIKADDSFEKAGFKKGQVYEFVDMGYFITGNYIAEVICVTDQLLLLKNENNSIIEFYYEELENLRKCSKLKKIK